MGRDQSERCVLNEGINVSPGPAKYNSVQANASMETSAWLKHEKSTFSRKKRTMEVAEIKLTDLARIPGPNHYLNPVKKDRDTAFHFAHAPRLTGFEAPNHINPGPGDYGRKRMFDNKIVVDYTKRSSSGFATASNFNLQHNKSSVQSSLGKKPHRETRFHSPTTAETKQLYKIIDSQIASAQDVQGTRKKKQQLNQSVPERHNTTQNSFNQRKGTLAGIGTPFSNNPTPIPSEYIYSQDPISIQVNKKKDRAKKSKRKMMEQIKQHRAINAKISTASASRIPVRKSDLRDYFQDKYHSKQTSIIQTPIMYLDKGDGRGIESTS